MIFKDQYYNIMLSRENGAHHAQTDLNEKSGAMHQTLIFLDIDDKDSEKQNIKIL